MQEEKMRGVKLIDMIIDQMKNKKCGLVVDHPLPVPVNILDKLAFPDSMPLSPALKKFLEFDGWLLSQQFSLFSGIENPEFEAVTIQAAVKEYLGDEYADDFKEIPKPFPSAKCIVLGYGSDSFTALLLTVPDKKGEYPVISIDVDDSPAIYLEACGIDVWIALESGFIDDADEEYESDMAKMRKKLFGDEEEDCLYL
jgi:hypothetical protein